MEKSTTDIDRKLAIYYHPLFQQTISLLTDLFKKDEQQPHNRSQQLYSKHSTHRKNQQMEQMKLQQQKYKQMKLKQQKQKQKQNELQTKKQRYMNNKESISPRISQSTFSLGLIQFMQFNLKLQKSLLPSFEIDNAIISGLNDWVKQVAECLNYQGMVSTSNCQQITPQNLQSLLRSQIINSKMELYQTGQKYLRTLMKFKNHDAFRLLGVKVNKQVFSKFMFDLCSTWCQFLDIEMFTYFLIAIYLQASQGNYLKHSKFRSTHMVQPIELEFMEQFQQIKQVYSKTRKKQLRYYRAWCQWNYLRVGEVGQNLILCLDNILDDNRVLQIAHVFQKAIKIINEQITSQSQSQTPQQTVAVHKQSQNVASKDFLIMKKLQTKQNRKQSIQSGLNNKNERSIQSQSVHNMENSIQSQNWSKMGSKMPLNKLSNIQKQRAPTNPNQKVTLIPQQKIQQAIRLQRKLPSTQGYYPNQSIQQTNQNEQQDDFQNFQIQIDQFGNMYLKRIVKIPIIGEKILPIEFKKKRQVQLMWIERKKQQCRQQSNLYGRIENMKVRLQHNVKNDYYHFKKNPKIAKRDKFYMEESQLGKQKPINQTKNKLHKQQSFFQKSIHEKIRPQQLLQTQQNVEPLKQMPVGYLHPKVQLAKQPIRKNEDYIHKVMAPSFLTDHKNNLSFMKQKQGTIYGVNAQDQKRDIKFNLPKIKFLKDLKIKEQASYHIIGKLTKDREVINERIKSISLGQAPIVSQNITSTDTQRIQTLKNKYRHVWTKYINQQQLSQLTNFNAFYQQLQTHKKLFSKQTQSSYRYNLKPIQLYQNKRYQMGGLITRPEQEKFYQKMAKLIRKDQRRKKKKQKKTKFRQYKRNFKNGKERSFYEQIFIDYHKQQIKNIKQQVKRQKANSYMVMAKTTVN